MFTRTHVKGGRQLVALAALFLAPGLAAAQYAYPGVGGQRFDQNAINAMLAAQQAASAGRSAQPAQGRFRYIASVTGSGLITSPLQVVNQFGPSNALGLGNVSPFSGASGVAGGAAVGVALAAQANLLHEPAGVQINSLYNSPIGSRFGVNSTLPELGGGFGGFGGGPYGGFGSLYGGNSGIMGTRGY